MTSVKSSITPISGVPTTKFQQQHQYTTVPSVAHRPQGLVIGPPPQPSSDPAGSTTDSTASIRARPLPLVFSGGRGAGSDSSMKSSNNEGEHNDDDDNDGQEMTVVPTTSPVTSPVLAARWECMEADFDSNCLTSFATSSASDSGVTSSESSSSAASAGDPRNSDDTTSTASTSRTCALIVAQDHGEDATEGTHVRRSYTHDPYCIYTGLKLISVCTCTTCVPPVAVAAEMAVRTGVSAFSSSSSSSSSTTAAHRNDSGRSTTTPSHHHASAKQSLSEAALAFDLQQSGHIAASRNITSGTPSPATSKKKSGFTAYPSTAVKRPTQQTWVAEKRTGGAESNSRRSASCFSQVQHFHYSPSSSSNSSLRHHAEQSTTSRSAAPHPQPPVSICTSTSTSTAKVSTTPTTSPLLSRYHHDSPSHGRHFWPDQV